jgi:citrate lyase subunit beta / citryl-CoA lyase
VIPLFVPADRPERYAKASASADAAILDLEDAVSPERKAYARDAVATALRASSAYWVRINPLGTADGEADVALLEGNPSPDAVLVAKAASPTGLGRLRARLPRTRIYALIETIAGIVELDALAATPGLSGLTFGAYDLCAELGARVTAEVIAPWRAAIVLAARRFGLDAIDTPYVNLADPHGLAEDARRSADFGFTGKFAVHPQQVSVIRAAFRPSAGEIARARAIVEGYAGGVAAIDGSMIDAPMLASARQLLERARKGST